MIERVKTCSCTLPMTNPDACLNCGIRYSSTAQQILFPVNPDIYDIDFGDDFILLRKKK